MTQNSRRIIFWGFVVTFFILSPLIVLYTVGIRYDPNGQLTETGTLVISTIPKNATVILNSEIIQDKTPSTITALNPDTYTIQLTKDGYLAWEKRLPMKVNEALFVSNIRLFRDTLPEQIIANNYSLFSLSPNGRIIVLVQKNNNIEQFYTFTIPDETLTLIAKKTITDMPTERLQWSPDSDYILAFSGASTQYLNLSEAKGFHELPSRSTKQHLLSHWRWDETDSDILYVADSAGDIYLINLAADSRTILPGTKNLVQTNEKLTDFAIYDNSIYVLIKNSEKDPTLRSQSLRNGKIKELTLPTANEYKFITNNNDKKSSHRSIVMIDDKGTLLVLNTSNDTFRLILSIDNVTKAVISPETNELLYSKLFEIWTYNSASDTRSLLMRTESQINDIQWYSHPSHILFAANDEIHIIERDGRDTRNRWQLASFNNLAGYMVSLDGDTLYFAGTIGNQEGLFRRKL